VPKLELLVTSPSGPGFLPVDGVATWEGLGGVCLTGLEGLDGPLSLESPAAEPVPTEVEGLAGAFPAGVALLVVLGGLFLGAVPGGGTILLGRLAMEEGVFLLGKGCPPSIAFIMSSQSCFTSGSEESAMAFKVSRNSWESGSKSLSF